MKAGDAERRVALLTGLTANEEESRALSYVAGNKANGMRNSLGESLHL